MRLAAKTALALAVSLGGCSSLSHLGSSQAGYPVFFTPFSARLEETAKGVIAQAAQQAKANPDAAVVVAGYATAPGSAKADLDLSRTRAQVVADTLMADGVPKSSITQRAKGQIDFTLDPIEARRVDITVGK